MPNHHEPSDQQNEKQLERLLKSGYADTPPAPEFQEALLQQLDQEFARAYLASSQLQNESSPSDAVTNDAVTNIAQAVTSAASHGATTNPEDAIELARDASPRRRRPLVSLRLAMSMAAAACLLLAVSLWSSQNVYGWASMLRALENCSWVQAASTTAGFSGWVSSQRGILAIQSTEQVAFHDRKEQSSSRYLLDQGVVYQQALSADHASPSPEKLFHLLLRNGTASDADVQYGYKVVSESWRRLDSGEGQSDGVELRVTLLDLGARRQTHKLLVVLDPETHLPKTCRLLTDEDDDHGSSKSLAFDYPTEGPESIFSLGIPEETAVVESLANLEALKITDARDSEANRSLGRAATRSTEKDASNQKNLAAKQVDSQEKEAARLAARPSTSEVDEEKNRQKKTRLASADPEVAARTVEVGEIVTVTPAAGKSAAGNFVTGNNDQQPKSQDLVASNPPRPTPEQAAFALPEKPLALTDLVKRVNGQFAANWQRQGITAAEAASDTEFLRRVYLDLTGRIPIVSEVYQFLEDDSPKRRERLVDELLASRDHATHLATVWRKLLLPEGTNTNLYGGTAKFDEWLADRFEKNVPYDQLVRELLLAEGRVSDSGPILFYAALKLNPEELAAKTARTFLGMRMECAQCHDHKFDDSITQEDFWGFAAHFAQISRPQGKMEMTSSVLRVRDNNRGEVMLPDTDEVIPPRLPYKITKAKKTVDEIDVLGKRTRRQKLVEWLTTKQNSRFARATVNRAWQHLFGLGLVEPVDDMRADNPATCPEVLETLSLDFAANDYNLRRLLRTLVLSNAYQLSSRAVADEPSQSLVFARMNIKSFSADQLYDCINVATEPESMGAGNTTEGALARFGNSSRQAFIEQFRAPPGQRTDYHAGIPQALTLMHGRLVHGATDLQSSGLMKSLNAPFFTDEQRIETLFLSTLSRFPEPSEQETMLAHVQAAASEAERSSALGDILWALLNSAEFTFIH